MSVRDPSRPLGIDLINTTQVYPRELCVDYVTGDIIIFDENNNRIYHKKPGFLTISMDDIQILESKNLSETINVDLSPILSNTVPLGAGVSKVGVSNYVARADHVHPPQIDVTGNAGTATKLETPRGISISGAVTAPSILFDGSKPITINATQLDATTLSGQIPFDSIPYATVVPEANGVATTGLSNKVAREDHVHPVQTTITGNAGTATKLQTPHSFELGNAVSSDFKNFDGTEDVIINVNKLYSKFLDGVLPSSVIPYAQVLPSVNGTASTGTSKYLAREDHVHPPQVNIQGNADTASKLQNKINISLAGGAISDLTNTDASSDIEINVTSLDATMLKNIVNASNLPLTSETDLPVVANINASAGISEKLARADHVHPVQTSVSGNAGTATKLETPRNISITGAITAEATPFDGSSDLVINALVVDANSISGTMPERFYKYPDPTTEMPKPNAEVANIGTSSNFARADHVHPNVVTITGNAGSATKLETPRNISLSGGAEGISDPFDGSSDIAINVTALDGSIINKGIIPGTSIPFAEVDVVPVVAGIASAGTSIKVARADHVHPAQTSVTGNAGTATKLQNKIKFVLGSNATGSVETDLSSDVSIPITELNSSVLVGSLPISVIPFDDLSPSGAGVASPGISNKISRADHVHPAQTSVTGNAGTATKLEKPINISLSGGATGSANSVDGSTNIDIGVTSLDASKLNGNLPESAFPVASETSSGIVSTTDQKFAGKKTFTKGVVSSDPKNNKGFSFSLNLNLPIASWTGANAPFKLTINNPDIKQDDENVMLDVIQTGNFENDKAIRTQYGSIYRAVTNNGSIDFYATKKPTIDLNLKLTVVR